MAENTSTITGSETESTGAEPAPEVVEATEAATNPATEVAAEASANAPGDIESAERVAFLSLAAELAKGLNVLVVDGGGGSLAGIAAHLDSVSLADLPAKQGSGYAMLVADLPADGGVPAQTVPAFAAALDQTAGFALIRVPNSPANAALRDHLSGTFANSTELRQANWVASAVLADEQFATEDPAQATASTLRKGAGATTGEELYTILIAAHGELPKLRPHVALARSRELRELSDELQRARESAAVAAAQAEARSAAQDEVIRELQEEIAWLDEHELNLRVKIEKRPWAMTLVNGWARFVGLARRAKSKLRW